MSYEERLRKLKLPTLKYSRHQGDMIELHKITSGRYDTNVTEFIKWRRDFSSRETGRGNQKKMFTQRTKLDLRKYSFTVRATKAWNNLPNKVVDAKNLNTFKNRLDRYWENQDMLFNFKSAMTYGTGSNVNSNKEYESDEEDLEGTCVGNHQ